MGKTNRNTRISLDKMRTCSISDMQGTSSNNSIEIKTSKLLNVIEQDKYVNIKKMIDHVDHGARMKIKNKDWFIDPDHSIASKRVLCLKKSLGYAKSLLRRRLQPFQNTYHHRTMSSDSTESEKQ